jgi:phosphoglucomutase
LPVKNLAQADLGKGFGPFNLYILIILWPFWVPEFQQQNYTENFLQCVLDGGLGDTKRGSVLVVGGDGRFLCTEVVNLAIKIAAANGVLQMEHIGISANSAIAFFQVSKLIIGRDGILSTPAVSHLIRKGDDNGRRINGPPFLPQNPKFTEWHFQAE